VVTTDTVNNGIHTMLEVNLMHIKLN